MSSTASTGRITVFCKKCSLRVSANITHQEKIDDTGPALDIYGDPLEVQRWGEYILARCPDCHSPFLVDAMYNSHPDHGNSLEESIQLFPEETSIRIENAPKSVAKAYREAAQCFNAGLWTPCVMMVRRSVEAILKHESGKNEMLFKLMETMKQEGKIDPHLANWFDMLRILGNEAAHDPERSFTKEEAAECIDFCEAAIEYLYEYKRKYDEFTKRQQFKATAVGKIVK